MPRQYGTTGEQSFASAPAVGVAGATYYNTTDNVEYISDGTKWVLSSEVYIGTAQPTPAYELWVDTDEVSVDAMSNLPLPVAINSPANSQVTATSMAALSTPVKCSLTTSFPVWVILSYSAWLAMTVAGTAGDIRASIDVSGATVIGPVAILSGGDGQDFDWGDVLYYPSGEGVMSAQRSAMRFVKCNAGTTTFEMFAYISGTGTYFCNYGSIRVMPVRWA